MQLVFGETSPDCHRPPSRLVTVCASEVYFKRTEWFARDRIPLGALTLLDGPGGIGKTTLLLGVIAAGTRGSCFFDGGNRDPITALVVAGEDAIGVLKARLEVAGADLSRVHFVKGVQFNETLQSFLIPGHVGDLERKIDEVGADIIHIDAMFNHLALEGEGRMSHQVRRALRPLVEMAERTGAAILGLRHWTKASGPAMQRALGSVELTNVARSVLSFGPHPEREGSFVFAPTKANLSAWAPALSYRIEVVDRLDDDGKPCEVTRAILDGIVEGITSDDLAMRVPCDPDERNVVGEWLRDALADGDEHSAAVILTAARREGIGSRATLYRAAQRIGVVMNRKGFAEKGGDQSTWRLPRV